MGIGVGWKRGNGEKGRFGKKKMGRKIGSIDWKGRNEESGEMGRVGREKTGSWGRLEGGNGEFDQNIIYAINKKESRG